ncbi:Parathyroid hormone/parathyroid hormone-related peptide receptor, partial [Clarias magur]
MISYLPAPPDEARVLIKRPANALESNAGEAGTVQRRGDKRQLPSSEIVPD